MHIILDILLLLATLVYSYIEAFVMLFVPVSPKDIRGKLVLVTGGGRGIGRCLALRFSQEGAKLAICDIDKSVADDTVQEIVNNGGTAEGYQCDVTNPKAVKNMADEIRRALGHVDILVNNAGVLNGKDILSLTEQDIRRTLDINTMAHFWTLKEFLPVMMTRDSGHVVTITSMAATKGTAFCTDYCASKWAAYGMTEALSVELKEKGKIGVKTTIICPAMTNTKLVSDIKHRIVPRVPRNVRLAVDSLKNVMLVWTVYIKSEKGLGENLLFRVKESTLPCYGFGQLLTPEDVAEAAVRGVLVDKPVVHVPDRLNSSRFLKTLTPKRFQMAVSPFYQTGFMERK